LVGGEKGRGGRKKPHVFVECGEKKCLAPPGQEFAKKKVTKGGGKGGTAKKSSRPIPKRPSGKKIPRVPGPPRKKKTNKGGKMKTQPLLLGGPPCLYGRGGGGEKKGGKSGGLGPPEIPFPKFPTRFLFWKKGKKKRGQKGCKLTKGGGKKKKRF